MDMCKEENRRLSGAKSRFSDAVDGHFDSGSIQEFVGGTIIGIAVLVCIRGVVGLCAVLQKPSPLGKVARSAG